jgi:hypothetical protein
MMLATKANFDRWKLLLARTLTKIMKPILETWQSQKWNCARKRQEPIFENENLENRHR